MTSVQERLQMKREPLDKWTIREQLCLASAVCRSGDQNWMSVSRSLKPFGEPNRPSDWFHQKNCAAQFGMLLGNVETPKRKKRASSVDTGIETPAENILKRLLVERQAELRKLLAEEKAEYQKLQEDMALLNSGKVTEEQLDKWCREIDEEEHRREQETLAHSQWLKEREQRKQEIERAWRPPKQSPPAIGQKRKNFDAIDALLEEQQTQSSEEMQPPPQNRTPTQEQQQPSKPALSPLLTSLLKSPSQVQNTSILQTAITGRPHPPVSSPMIVNLLNSNNEVPQIINSNSLPQDASVIDDQPIITNDILDDSNMPNIKIDDLASSILVEDGPLPEIKKEEVDDIISEIIESAQDIVDDPEQHLQLDGNGDINIMEIEDFEDEELGEPEKPKETETVLESPIKETNLPMEPEVQEVQEVDPFEFKEDPVIFEPSMKPSGVNGKQENKMYVPHYQQAQATKQMPEAEKPVEVKEEKEQQQAEPCIQEETATDTKTEILDEETSKSDPSTLPGSVEIVEVVVTEDEDTDKETNQSVVEEVVLPSKSDTSIEIKMDTLETVEEDKPKIETEESCTSESKDTVTFEESSEASDTTLEPKKDTNTEVVVETSETTARVTPDITEELYDEVSMEVKVDKSGKVKRDYSRTKKKEDHTGFDMLLAIEKAQLEDNEMADEATFSSDQAGPSTSATCDPQEKRDNKSKHASSTVIKAENDRSSSPWTEEEDNTSKSKRSYSMPATPVDSVPNSPASSLIFYEDDKEYRNWKKSVMLVYNRLATNKYASLFLKPINDDQAPGYSAVVNRPMDLQTIKKNIDNGTIRTTLEFKRDIMLMFANAMMYNKSGGTIYNMAMQMWIESLQPIEILMQATMSQESASLRRETRTSESGTKRKRTITDEMIIKAKKKKDD